MKAKITKDQIQKRASKWLSQPIKELVDEKSGEKFAKVVSAALSRGVILPQIFDVVVPQVRVIVAGGTISVADLSKAVAALTKPAAFDPDAEG